eukprot:scaffold26070_cov107-Isochrysis_galbana.AAC.1
MQPSTPTHAAHGLRWPRRTWLRDPSRSFQSASLSDASRMIWLSHMQKTKQMAATKSDTSDVTYKVMTKLSRERTAAAAILTAVVMARRSAASMRCEEKATTDRAAVMASADEKTKKPLSSGRESQGSSSRLSAQKDAKAKPRTMDAWCE